MSIIPENENNEIDYVAFAFVYGYNENEMMIHNATLNISSIGYTFNTFDNSTKSEDTNDNPSETQQDICIIFFSNS